MTKPATTRQFPAAANGIIALLVTAVLGLFIQVPAYCEFSSPVDITKALKGTWTIISLNDGDRGEITFDGDLHYGKTKWFDASKVQVFNSMVVFENGMTFEFRSTAPDELMGQWKGHERKMVRVGAKPTPAPLPPVPEVKPVPSAPPLPPVKSTPAASTPVAAAAPSIKLKPGWDTPMQGGSRTLKELAFVLDGYGKANANPEIIDVDIYNGVKFLMALKEAVTALGLNQRLPSAKEVSCSGFPRGSFNYVSFDGVFEGHFNRLDLVTDSANQVVCVELVDENPKSNEYGSYAKRGDYSTYNFVENRMKAITTMKVEYSFEELYRNPYSGSSGSGATPLKWMYVGLFSSPGKPYLRRINATLFDKPNKRKEQTQWYVPKPLADLILYCISKGQ